MSDTLIDPEEFPFTESELCDALSLLADRDRAVGEAATHAAGMRREAADRAVYRDTIAGWRPDPSAPVAMPAPDEAVPVLSYGIYIWNRDDALALLTLVGPELARRVQAYRAERRRETRSGRERQATWRATGSIGSPMPRDVEVMLDAEDAAAERAWELLVRRMTRRVVKAGRGG